MFDIGWTELMVIGVVALIVVGPKDLPGMFRTLGRFTGKIKGMAREFSQAMNDAADESGVKDMASTLKSATNPKKMGLDKLNEAATKFEAWDPAKATSKSERGPATQALTEERAAAKKKIEEATAKAASERVAREKAAEEAAATPAVKPKAKAKPKAKPAAKAKAKPASKAKPAAKAKAKPAKPAGDKGA